MAGRVDSIVPGGYGVQTKPPVYLARAAFWDAAFSIAFYETWKLFIRRLWLE